MPSRLVCGLLLLGSACGGVHASERTATPGPTPPPAAEAPATAPGKEAELPPVAAEPAPPPSPRRPLTADAQTLRARVESHFRGHEGRRIHVQTDKPLYRPGEIIWVRTFDLRARDLAGQARDGGAQYQLVSPKGAVVLRARVRATNGFAAGDFVLPEGAQGGEYTVRVIAGDGLRAERPIVVSAYEPPRLKKKLEFLRKAYGGGDEVTATLRLERPTGEPLRRNPLTAAIRLDGQDLPRVRLETNDEGGALVRFRLPRELAVGDGLLTVLVEDGGVTESISRRIPIVTKRMQLAFFPEGGKLVAGLPTRLYFEAKDPRGKPADVSGELVDELGNAVARFASHKDGLGRLDFTPATGRTYRARLTKPAGIAETYALPLAEAAGCVLRTYDDLDGQERAVRVAVRCSERRTVIVSALVRERLLDAAALEVPEGGAAVAHLASADPALAGAAGVARVTLFDERLSPLAERLVFRNRRARLRVEITPDKARYVPRERVELSLRTLDPAGNPVPADLALSVVDDTVLSFADDKTGHILSRLLLEPELPGKVEEPNAYLDLTEARSALALDLLMGTRGYRTFEWRRVLNPPPPPRRDGLWALRGFGVGGGGLGAAQRIDDLRSAKRAVAVAAAPMAATAPREGARPTPARQALARAPEVQPVAGLLAANERVGRIVDWRRLGGLRRGEAGGGERVADDKDFAAARRADVARARGGDALLPGGYAPVRVFPAPSYAGAEAPAVRSDFRETLHWLPSVMTGADGRATVRFYLSDAVSSFRVVTEGVGRGAAGRAERVLASSLPFSLAAKLPLELSAGDRVLLPLTFTNERDTSLDVTLRADVGGLLRPTGAPLASALRLSPGARESVFLPLAVTGRHGRGKLRFSAAAGALRDELERELVVAPLGFPQTFQRSGSARGRVAIEVDVGDAEPATFDAALTLYPSPTATLTAGVEALLREPSGCFEQASSTNYPNVMAMKYLQEHDQSGVAAIEKTRGLLERGYRKLAGYETRERGYEWFGGAPGHEALTAYGLLQFQDMRAVYGGVDDDMVARTAAWLRARRDGRGGYQRNARALDSFGRATPEVTDAYITYSLAQAGATDLGAELARVERLAASTGDQYVRALAAGALLASAPHRARGAALARALAREQDADGAWRRADHSITRSGGQNLVIETTALALLALLDTGEHEAAVQRAVAWLHANRGGHGQWGTTQATVLALKALTRHATAARKTRGPGTLTLVVNGAPAGRIAYAAGHREPLVFRAIAPHLRPGKNRLELRHEGDDALPYSLAVGYRSARPATSPHAVVDLSTALERPEVTMGETVRLVATVTNKTPRGQPMALARVGLPGGLTFQPWQLKDLRERGAIAFAETRAREVIVYFRDLKPGETKVVPLDLVATVPGTYTAPASSAYLYYTDEHKTWVPGVAVSIRP